MSYKLIEGKQYDICNALLPFINTVPHGTLHEQPDFLEKVKGFSLSDAISYFLAFGVLK